MGDRPGRYSVAETWLQTCEDPGSDPSAHIQLDMAARARNPSAPVARWELKTEHPQKPVGQPASLAHTEVNKRKSQTR